ncbi:MAG: hypothetical protein IAG13_17450 [Deltaproteobacteria bacterium]|nr:hypothetical protein [Nannocystaceae bacterium]
MARQGQGRRAGGAAHRGGLDAEMAAVLAWMPSRGHHARVRRIGAVVVIGGLALAGCRERNPAFVPDAVGSSGAVSSTGVAVTSSGGHTGTGTVTGTGTGSSEGGSELGGSEGSSGGDGSYPACDPDADPPCPRDWDECIELDDPPRTWCSHACDDDDDCEPPSDGDAEPVCAGPSGDSCALDCSDDRTCPTGMECEKLFGNVIRCVWPR